MTEKYKNPDPGCHAPYSPGDYCWSYACHVDGEEKYKDMTAICRRCEYYNEGESELVLITNTDREILRVMAHQWFINEMRLPGGICYQDVIDMLKRFGVNPPPIETALKAFENIAKKAHETEIGSNSTTTD